MLSLGHRCNAISNASQTPLFPLKVPLASQTIGSLFSLCRSLIVQGVVRLRITSASLALSRARRGGLPRRQLLLGKAGRVVLGTRLDVELCRAPDHYRYTKSETTFH